MSGPRPRRPWLQGSPIIVGRSGNSSRCTCRRLGGYHPSSGGAPRMRSNASRSGGAGTTVRCGATLLVNALLIILFLSATHGGRVHDLRIAEATPYPLPAGSQLLQDLGFLAFRLPEVEILMPTKKPRGQELTLDPQAANQELHCRRQCSSWLAACGSSVSSWPRGFLVGIRISTSGSLNARKPRSCNNWLPAGSG